LYLSARLEIGISKLKKIQLDKGIIKREIVVKTSRSSGSGGQHVNKVSTKVEIHFHVQQSQGLTELEKDRINNKLSNRITNSGNLVVSCQQTRSQHKNKELAINKLFKLLKKGIYVRPPRKSKGISKAYHAKRLQKKREHSEKKALRKSVKFPSNSN